MAFGITYAVILFSIDTTSEKGMINCKFDQRLVAAQRCPRSSSYASDPAKDVCVEAEMMFRDVEASLHEDVPLDGAAIVCRADQSHVCETMAKHAPSIR